MPKYLCKFLCIRPGFLHDFLRFAQLACGDKLHSTCYFLGFGGALYGSFDLLYLAHDCIL